MLLNFIHTIIDCTNRFFALVTTYRVSHNSTLRVRVVNRYHSCRSGDKDTLL